MKQAILYMRFSPRPDAGTSQSNEKQEDRCRVYCQRQSYEVAGVFADANISGKLLSRPGLSDALAALRPGMVLVVDTADRLARDMLVALTLHHQIEQRGAQVEAADGSPSRATPEGKLFANILAAFAQYERERFARRTKAGLARKRAQGVHVGRIPVGYRLETTTKKLIPDEWEQQAMERAKQLTAERVKSPEIAVMLTREFGPFRGRPWHARTVRKFLLAARRAAF